MRRPSFKGPSRPAQSATSSMVSMLLSSSSVGSMLQGWTLPQRSNFRTCRSPWCCGTSQCGSPPQIGSALHRLAQGAFPEVGEGQADRSSTAHKAQSPGCKHFPRAHNAKGCGSGVSDPKPDPKGTEEPATQDPQPVSANQHPQEEVHTRILGRLTEGTRCCVAAFPT